MNKKSNGTGNEKMLQDVYALIEKKRKDDGCFIPYIGKEFHKGIKINSDYYIESCYKEHQRILVIGARHYCDAMYNSRNVLARVDQEELEKIINNSNKHNKVAHFDSEWQLGCVLPDPSPCLKEECSKTFDKKSCCPVFEKKKCQLNPDTDYCWYNHQRDNKCDMKHCRLECETLYAVIVSLTKNYAKKNDAVDTNKTVQSRNRDIKNRRIKSYGFGKSYFENISQFIKREFHLSDDDKDLWESISYMNLIQRYIPYALREILNHSEAISPYIEKSDKVFCEEIIKILKPDIIITTMECVKESINGMDTGYYCVRRSNENFSVFMKSDNTDNSHPRVWEEKIQTAIQRYVIPVNNKKFKADISGLIYKIGEEEKYLEPKEIRNAVYRALVENIKKDSKKGDQQKYKSTKRNKGPWETKSFDFDLDEKTRIDSFRIWLSKYKQKPDLKTWEWL